MSTYNININSIESIYSPLDIKSELSIDEDVSNQIISWRETVSNIISGKDNRIILIVGPCSIHDPKAALEYANFLLEMKKKFKNEIFILMRVYFEKPRTTIGWKGLINDPYLNDTYKINDGLKIARKLLIDINKLGLPVACEFLDVLHLNIMLTW